MMMSLILATWRRSWIAGLTCLACMLAVAGGEVRGQSCTTPPAGASGGWQRCTTIPYWTAVSGSGVSDGIASWSARANEFGQSITAGSETAAAQSGIRIYLADLGGLNPFTRQGIGARINYVFHPGTNRNLSVYIRFNSNTDMMDQNAGNYQTYLRKLTVHEVGHSFGLGDIGGTCGSQTRGASVMNGVCKKNDSDDNIPPDVTNCDANRATAWGSWPSPTNGRYECVGESECGYNEYGVGPDLCSNPGWDPENCGGTGSGEVETQAEECEESWLSAEYCDEMCYEGEGADLDLNCNGWDDWSDCDFYYGECPPPVAPSPMPEPQDPTVVPLLGAVHLWTQAVALLLWRGSGRRRDAVGPERRSMSRCPD
jgi:hypothetical protein